MSTAVRAMIRGDLERRRRLNVEARDLRARLDKLAAQRSALSMASLAMRYNVSLAVVQGIAGSLAWTDEEKRTLLK